MEFRIYPASTQICRCPGICGFKYCFLLPIVYGMKHIKARPIPGAPPLTQEHIDTSRGTVPADIIQYLSAGQTKQRISPAVNQGQQTYQYGRQQYPQSQGAVFSWVTVHAPVLPSVTRPLAIDRFFLKIAESPAIKQLLTLPQILPVLLVTLSDLPCQL